MSGTSLSYELVTGNKSWSSWSLRPWLLLKVFGIPFRETLVRLRQPNTKERILNRSPSGKVPALVTGDLVIWDSLAIMEYLAEEHPGAPLWPRDKDARALARAGSAEMHSGFYPLRARMPMDFLHACPCPPLNDELAQDIRRIVAIWRDCRGRSGGEGGPFLFGGFSIADAMFAPVATRFRTYNVDIAAFGDDGAAAAYCKTVLDLPEMAEWGRGAALEQAGEVA